MRADSVEISARVDGLKLLAERNAVGRGIEGDGKAGGRGAGDRIVDQEVGAVAGKTGEGNVGQDRGRIALLMQCVGAASTIKHIGACVTVQPVVIIAALEVIITRATTKKVDSLIAIEAVVAVAAVKDVVAGRAVVAAVFGAAK